MFNKKYGALAIDAKGPKLCLVLQETATIMTTYL